VGVCAAAGLLALGAASASGQRAVGSSVVKLQSTTLNRVFEAPNFIFLFGVGPVILHDTAFVIGQPGAPAPTGQVVFEFFGPDTNCTGPSILEPPVAGPPWNSIDRTLVVGGIYTWKAHYLGDDTYLPSDSPCVGAVVLDANIQISPLAASNTVGTSHTLTVHVNINQGNGFVNTYDGTLVDVSLTNAGGANAGFGSAGGPTTTTCTTGTAPSAPGSGDCQVTIVSSAAGTTTVHASVTVNTLPPFDLELAHRETGDGHPGDGPDATKRWAGGAEACPQGFWKNNPQAWGPSGFSPSQTLGSVFTGTGIPGTTLLAALRLKGGPTVQDAKNILLRSAVTALLNAGDGRVNFGLSVDAVVTMVDAALASDNRASILALSSQLDAANSASCPLG